MKKTSLFVCLFVFALCGVDGLQVIIDYSFRVPEKFGAATPESANCCEFGKLPENDTQGMAPPTIIGIGVQKGGTTTLFDHFRVHPRLINAKKELHYLDSGSNKSYISYLKSWDRNQKGPWKTVSVNGTNTTVVVPPENGGLFEISPSYLLVPFSACKAKVIAPHGKFIVFLRDPTSRIHSGVSYTVQVMRKRPGNKSWMARSFWSLVREGLQEVGQDPKCSFQTGNGEFDYNDCWGCVLRVVKFQTKCAQRPFVTLTDSKGSYECNSVGKEHVLRGMYGPQLAWWFTLYDPSQFKIVNSNKFFSRPLEVMKDIGKFLDLHPTYTEWMIKRSSKKANVGHYRDEDPAMVNYAKSVLKEFYRRPNLELYRLLHEAGHRDFEPFEKELQGMELLNCSNPKAVASGICGDPRFHKNHPEYDPDAGRLPLRVERAVRTIQREDPKKDAIAVMKETIGGSGQEDFTQQSIAEVDGDAAEEDSRDTEVPTDEDEESMEAFGTIEESSDATARREEETTDGHSDAASAERSSTDGENDADKHSEVTSSTAEDKPADSGWLLQNGAQATPTDGEQSTRGDASYLGFTFRKEEKLEQQAARNGMATADHFVHFMYGVVFTALIFYCYRWLKKRHRR